MSIYLEASRIDVDAVLPSGQHLQIFSSADERVIQTHLQLMKQFSIGGPFVQRFLSDIKDSNLKLWKNKILSRVRQAAALNSRTFAVMYDLSGLSNQQVRDILLNDVREFEISGVFQDSNCMTRSGMPLIALWGLGFNDRNLDPSLIQEIIGTLKQRGFAVMGGVPFYYGRGGGDVSPDPRWKYIFDLLDVVSPWAVGRYQNLAEL